MIEFEKVKEELRKYEYDSDGYNHKLDLFLEKGISVPLNDMDKKVLENYSKINEYIIMQRKETSTKSSAVTSVYTGLQMPFVYGIPQLKKLTKFINSKSANELIIYKDKIKIKGKNNSYSYINTSIYLETFEHSMYHIYEKRGCGDIYELMGLEDDFSDADCSFEFSLDDYKQLQKTNTILEGKENIIQLDIGDSKIKITIYENGDVYGDRDVSLKSIETDKEMSFSFYVQYFNFVEGDYKIHLYDNENSPKKAIVEYIPENKEDINYDGKLFYVLAPNKEY